jgi:hypothetical protein
MRIHLPVWRALPGFAFCLCVLTAQALSAAPSRAPEVSFLAVVPSAEGLEIRIAADKPVTPVVSRLSNPARLVFDFPGLIYHGAPRTEINQGPILRVRASSFRLDPPTARIVVDSQYPVAYHLQAEKTIVAISVSSKPQSEPTAPPSPALAEKFSAGSSAKPAAAAAGTKRAPHQRPAPSVPIAARTVVPPQKQSTPETAYRSPVYSGTPVPIPYWEPAVESNLKVSFRNGLLTVAANNATLGEIFLEIGVKVGTVLEMPEMPERVLTTRGPAPPRDVIAALLEGSPYQFELLESDPGRLQKIVISLRPQ